MDKKVLRKLSFPIVVVGIGNILKGDDAAGPELVKRLKAAAPGIAAVECGDTPENYLGEILSHNARSILFMDAVEMGKKPGMVKLFPMSRIAQISISTHGMPLYMVAEYLKQQTQAEVYLLGIQPKKIRLGEHMTQEVEASVADLVELLSSMNDLSGQPPQGKEQENPEESGNA